MTPRAALTASGFPFATAHAPGAFTTDVRESFYRSRGLVVPQLGLIAFGVLIACLGTLWLLGRAELVGHLAVTGFVLGSLSTASVYVMLA